MEQRTPGESDVRTRVLLVGWFSFVDGEATSGDVGAAKAVSAALRGDGVAHDIAWSPGFHPEGPSLGEVDPAAYSHLVFVCGPVSGHQVEELHRAFASCRRIAVGVSVPDPRSPAFLGFHTVLARDGAGEEPERDLAAGAPAGRPVPVVGVATAPGQREYRGRSAHAGVHRALERWLVAKDCARVPVDTRLDTADWLHCGEPHQFDALVRRMDLLVTTRLHGLVLALRNGVPAVVVDPVAGGAKVAAQGRVWDWPVETVGHPEEEPDPGRLDRLWKWCLDSGRQAARSRSGDLGSPLLGALSEALRAHPSGRGRT
ncbi:polysaccharide pyruvyl transferase [Nocardiopsis sp. TSRI0078]|uniref:polysaccharide pyruvyl transferase family protein n=1 Tax=unclassified Nocardiopsis TaxID=2649073 RepID=UPI00093CADF0|nr:polysaccharide pyruvyl transferase family protein [Nocardiopsis sp. TSRI0078]OKI15813.1 polysaccharide pyruvyl transferase [Nocardiopsis sp. TSRI0078]